MNSTNQEKPFEPGETIDYCDDHFVVIANHGNSGAVREVGGTQSICPFYWTFQDQQCKRVAPSVAPAA